MSLRNIESRRQAGESVCDSVMGAFLCWHAGWGGGAGNEGGGTSIRWTLGAVSPPGQVWAAEVCSRMSCSVAGNIWSECALEVLGALLTTSSD